ncbi:MAG: hypothetical protein JXR37_16345 [Kiritimatiellae bacterium]|nr:hypothetical protein [Kiritimatiellia bacterium]
MQALVDAVERFNPDTIAVVGLAKNCGKTTALNCLLREYARRQTPLGVTSAGRDGEAEDALTRQPKPAVTLPAAALAATAEQTLGRWAVPYKVLDPLGLRGAMGEILLVRAEAEGKAELAGPPTAETVLRAVRELQRLGAKRVLIDGAFDRIAVGHPGLADAVVLAGGAVLGAAPASVARVVREKVDLLRLPPLPPESRAPLQSAVSGLGSRVAAVSAEMDVRQLPRTALVDPRQAAAAAGSACWLVCGGAVTDALLDALLAARVTTCVVANDPTRVFVSAAARRRWHEAGGGLSVLFSISLAAVVTNPHNPGGPDLDPEALIDAVGAGLGVPVFDVVAGLARNV